MAFFNEFKEKFNKAAQSVTSKTKEGVEITRLAGESRGLQSELSAVYEQIGRSYVDARGEDVAAIQPLCARANELRDRIEELERQKLQIRNQNRCPACGAVMAKGARFCSNCGRRMPEPQPEEEAAPVQDVHYCPDCGAMRSNEDRFCEVCGHDYEAETAPEAQAVVEVPAPEQIEESADEAPTDFSAE